MYDRIIMLSFYCLFVRKYLMVHYLGIFQRDLNNCWPLSCPSLRSGQFRGQIYLAHVEVSLENEPFCSTIKISHTFLIGRTFLVIPKNCKTSSVHTFHNLWNINFLYSPPLLEVLITSESGLAVDTVRKACGGHGFMTNSSLPRIFGMISAACTYEGENTVLQLQIARLLIFILLKHERSKTKEKE